MVSPFKCSRRVLPQRILFLPFLPFSPHLFSAKKFPFENNTEGIVKLGHMARISVALATYNEEKNIADCLDSVKDWVSEIVIVDGYSSDHTVEIAERYGVKVIKSKNVPIFHINKQKAIDAATGDWILQLDADERVSVELGEEILRVTGRKDPLSKEINGYWIPRKNWFLGRFLKKGGQYPDFTLRLYKRGKGHLPCKSVHEQAKVEGKVAYLENDLIHLADPNFERYLTRFNRYTSLIAEEMVEKKVALNFLSVINYLFLKPTFWFLWTYFRHKGYQDGPPGFIFSSFSSFRYIVAYIKYWEKSQK